MTLLNLWKHDLYLFQSAFTQTDEDPAHGFSQAFVLKPANASWFIAHDVFRLAIHDVAASV